MRHVFLSIRNIAVIARKAYVRHSNLSQHVSGDCLAIARNNGFSLIELVVVLVIIGLIVGGITSGQNLIRSAQLQSVITDIKKYESSSASFQERYFQLPGDMNNATDFWGAAHTTASTCLTTASTGEETCNGDANGIISTSTGSNEYFRAWQHLANAGLLEGSFPGVQGSEGAAHAVPGTNVPESRISGAGYSFFNVGSRSSDSTYYDGEYGNAIFFGKDANSNAATTGEAITTEEAWNADKKTDDGRPGYGSVRTFKTNHSANCATGDTATAEYKLTQSSNSCALIFITGF